MTAKEFETAYLKYLRDGGPQPERGPLSIGQVLRIINKIRKESKP